MATLTFDTLKFANRLKAAGVPNEHAEAEASALAEVFETHSGQLVTRDDLKALEDRLDAKLIQLEQRMTIKLGSLMVIAIGVVAALVKVL